MSYDLGIWSAQKPDLAALFLDEDGWIGGPDGYSRGSTRWQVAVSGPDRVLPEDVPDGVGDLIPGVAYVTELSVEPLSAPKTAFRLAWRVARRIAKSAHGAVFDLQEGTVSTPAGQKRFVPFKRPERFSLVNMTWWFTESPLNGADGVDALLELLRRRLPEALPRRYGDHEPPQYRLEEMGFDHFRAFLHENLTGILPAVWYPHRPVLDVSIRPEPEWGVGRRGFRCGYVSLEVERLVLAQPGWQRELIGFWKQLSQLVHPFYGDVRSMGGFIPAGGTYAVDMETDLSPVAGPSWRGVPRDPGHACVCGREYLSLWPTFAEHAEMQGNLGFITGQEWNGADVIDLAGPVPDMIAQPNTRAWIQSPNHGGAWVINPNATYPPLWPFGNRPDPDPL